MGTPRALVPPAIREYHDEPFIFETRSNSGKKWSPEELGAHTADGGAASPPGVGDSRLSNTDYVLLGLAIEKAGSAPLASQLQDRMFAPLKMTATRSWENMDLPSPAGEAVPPQWPTAPVDEALELQRPLSADKMKIVARGERKDNVA